MQKGSGQRKKVEGKEGEEKDNILALVATAIKKKKRKGKEKHG